MALYVTFQGQRHSRLKEGSHGWALHKKNNQYYIITFDSTPKNKTVTFSNMAGGGHIGFVYCGARGGVADKHLGDLLCLGTR